jgi:hypothetical protein
MARRGAGTADARVWLTSLAWSSAAMSEGLMGEFIQDGSRDLLIEHLGFRRRIHGWIKIATTGCHVRF